jgi:hypothetical protein
MRPATTKESFKYALNRLLGRKSGSGAKRKPRRKQIFSIGIYTGQSPIELNSARQPSLPVLTRESVSDVRAGFVADPFMIKVDGAWNMFFEVMNLETKKGEIALATSPDALRWSYQGIVLREHFHLSYPYIFEWQGDYYMIPEAYRTKSVRLYRAVDFPDRWSFVTTLIDGDDFVDPSIFYFNERWWLFTDLHRPPYFAGTLRLYGSKRLEDGWNEHPESPVVQGDPHVARPGGRVIEWNGKPVRYTQDCSPNYGTQVRAFEITECTPVTYRERAANAAPIVSPSGSGWNASGMHHVDAHQEGGQWIACVDGYSWESE